MNTKWLSIASGVLLLLGMFNGWPYGYYTFLRLAICGISIYNTISFSKLNLSGWVLIFAALAILFNPLLPIYLNKSTWVGIDLISAIIFFFSTFSIKAKE